MLESILRYLNNRFDEDENGRCYGRAAGQFVIENGTLEVDCLKEGQYYWIEGSTFNDGLHQYKSLDLVDETFEGAVIGLAIPAAVISVSVDVEQFINENADVLASPMQSESFGGYSYTKASNSAQGNEMPAADWQVKFGAMLRPFKKISRDWQ